MIQVAHLSLKGKRSANQDRILVPEEPNSGRFVAGVADGLGGMRDGDKAAEIAIQTLSDSAMRLLDHLDSDAGAAKQSLAEVYADAHLRVRHYADQRQLSGSVATTLVALIVSGGKYLIGNEIGRAHV